MTFDLDFLLHEVKVSLASRNNVSPFIQPLAGPQAATEGVKARKRKRFKASTFNILWSCEKSRRMD